MNVLFTQSARADIAAIFEFISRDNRIAAQQVVAAIERATDRLAQFPLSGRVGGVPATRELVVPRLPFIVVYQVTSTSVEIIGVFHAAQDRPRG